MDKIKKYIRCGFKIVTSWKFIVFFLGITFICYYILLNRYEIHNLPNGHVLVVDRITGHNCEYAYYGLSVKAWMVAGFEDDRYCETYAEITFERFRDRTNEW